MVNHLAFYDALALAGRIDRRLGSVVGPEIHLFAYLACLLAVYRGWPPADWGYRFACTGNGAPYSHEIQCAVDELLSLGHLVGTGESILVTQEGKELESFLSSMETQRQRLPFIDGACSSLLGMSVGIVRQAVSEEPTIKKAASLSRNQLLLDDASQQLIYEEFDKITAAIGTKPQDLMVPAVVWLTKLAKTSARTEAQ
jgi:hypothetical protein